MGNYQVGDYIIANNYNIVEQIIEVFHELVRVTSGKVYNECQIKKVNMNPFKIGDKIRFKQYVRDNSTDGFYKTYIGFDVFKEYIITDKKGNTLTINGKNIDDSFVEKVNMENKFKVGDIVFLIGDNWSKIYPDNYTIIDVKNNYIYLKDFAFQNIHFSCLKLVETMPTKEQVLKSASTSPEAKLALKELFPQYFEDEKYFDLTKYKFGDLLGDRISGKWMDKGYYLHSNYNWEIIIDDDSSKILIPTKK